MSENLFHEGTDRYPISTVIFENILIVTWFVTGHLLLKPFSEQGSWLYLGFGFIMAYIVMRIIICKHCYYYGKRCHTGWGKISALLTSKGETKRFGCGAAGKSIPMFYALMTIIPLIFGIIKLVKSFDFSVLIVFGIFLTSVILSSVPVRKSACKKCKMKEICPGSLSKTKAN